MVAQKINRKISAVSNLATITERNASIVMSQGIQSSSGPGSRAGECPYGPPTECTRLLWALGAARGRSQPHLTGFELEIHGLFRVKQAPNPAERPELQTSASLTGLLA
jgi:hypothetical protein